jgi:hypothetical protein
VPTSDFECAMVGNVLPDDQQKGALIPDEPLPLRYVYANAADGKESA